jgi:hypothetical protein
VLSMKCPFSDADVTLRQRLGEQVLVVPSLKFLSIVLGWVIATSEESIR